MAIIVYTVNDITKHDIPEINVLLTKNLSENSKEVSLGWIKKVMKNGFIFLARDISSKNKLMIRKGKVVGMVTLIPYHKLTGYVGIKEDVVVLKKYRGYGIGGNLMEMFYKYAKKIGLKHVDFTSNPDRISAHALYRKIPGCSDRKTLCFRTNIS